MHTFALELLLIAAVCGYYTVNGQPYYGELLGPLVVQEHGVAGDVYVVDKLRLFIKGFSYDGMGPDAFFYVGMSGEPSDQGRKIPNEMGSESTLKEYDNEDIVLNLPSNLPVSDLRWLSVWCRKFRVNFGSLSFTATTIPATSSLSALTPRAHGVSSGIITLLDQRRMLITNLTYDGFGPDAYFWACTTETPDASGTIVPNENGSIEKLSAYTGKDVTITLPMGRTWGAADVKSLGLWCKQATENFGEVITSSATNLPPYMVEPGQAVLANCEMLGEHLNVAWEIINEQLVVELMGAIDEDSGYMSFGVSGSPTGSVMVGGDVAVASYNSAEGTATVQDYYLEAKAFCSGVSGSCPDSSRGGRNQLELLNSWRMNGVTTVRYQRPLITGETSTDRTISSTGETYVIWAFGVLNSQGFVTKHTERLQGDMKLALGRSGMRSCNAVKKIVTEDVVGWTPEVIRVDQNPVIKARIGPTGGLKGFQAITGETSWGIAWYLNGKLIPEVVIQRGETVTFHVFGGNDTSNSAKYHPLYITNDKKGGYAAKSQAEKDEVDILAGPKVGQYCEYEVTEATKPAEEYTMFDDYFETLELKCTLDNVDAGAGVFTWSPDNNTPDTVYYQCYTHQMLGWKIIVVDEYADYFNGAPSLGAAAVTLLLTAALSAAVLLV